MKKNVKQSLTSTLIIATALCSAPNTSAIPKDMSIGATAIVGAVLAMHNDELTDSKPVKWLAQKTGADSRDLVNSSMWSTVLWGSSYFVKNNTIKTLLRATSLATPIIGMAIPKKMCAKVSSLPFVKDYFSFCSSLRNLPLIGTYFTCKNKACETVCNDCKLTRLYQALPALFGSGYVAKKLGIYCAKKIEETAKKPTSKRDTSKKTKKRKKPNDPTGNPGNNDKEEEPGNSDNLCSICSEHELDITLPCGNNHRFCKECTQNWFYQRGFGGQRYFDFYKTCPLCRGNINQAALEERLFG